MKLPRFSLRTLFLLVAVAAALSWICFVDKEKFIFEFAAKRLKAGDDLNASSIQNWTYRARGSHAPPFNGRLDPFVMRIIELRAGIYCVYFTFSDARETRCKAVQVYRLPPPPPGYRSKAMAQSGFEPTSFFPLMDYVDDFILFLNGFIKTPSAKYELIHSDPAK